LPDVKELISQSGSIGEDFSLSWISAASKSVVAVTGEATRRCPIGQCSTGQLHRLIVRSSKWPWPQTKERHMPISQERELEIEQELAAIVRELERRPSTEKRGPKKPEQAVQLPVGTILLDE
jgi:hypothetical protein